MKIFGVILAGLFLLSGDRMVKAEVDGAVLEESNEPRGLLEDPFRDEIDDLKSECPSEDRCESLLFFIKQYTMVNPGSGDTICTWQVATKRREGFVCQSEASKRRFLFAAGRLEDDPSQRRIAEIVEDLHGNIHGTFFEKKGVLSPETSAELKHYADSMFETKPEGKVEDGIPISDDFLFQVDPSVLKSLIGMDNIMTLYKYFKQYDERFPVSRILLRRTKFVDEMHLDWHDDGDNMVMHVWLDEENIKGGSYMFLGPNGTDEVKPATGSILVHGQHVVHAINTFVGKRYHLLLVGDNLRAKDVVQELIAQEEMVAEEF